MKVILQKDVKGTGKAGDVCEVNDGYARNFLIPRKLALPGDASSINAANIKKQADAHRLEMQRKRAKELSAGMNSAISGIAGIGHILLGISMVMLLLQVKKSVAEK